MLSLICFIVLLICVVMCHVHFQNAKLVISVNLSKLSCSFIIFYSYIKRFFVNFALKMENGCRFKGDMCCFLRAKCEDA